MVGFSVTLQRCLFGVSPKVRMTDHTVYIMRELPCLAPHMQRRLTARNKKSVQFIHEATSLFLLPMNDDWRYEHYL